LVAFDSDIEAAQRMRLSWFGLCDRHARARTFQQARHLAAAGTAPPICVYGGEIDIDAYTRAATTLIDGHPALERAKAVP
jgi:hypothetical protein